MSSGLRWSRGRLQSNKALLDDEDRRRPLGDAVYLLAILASGSLVAATNYYLVEPVSLALLYAIPVGLAGYRFGYRGAFLGGSVGAMLTLLSPSLRPGTLFFDVLVLCAAVVLLAGLMAARVGTDPRVLEPADPVDHSTGLASRRAMLGALSMELVRCGRYGRPVSLLLAGLDVVPGAGSQTVGRLLYEVGLIAEGDLRDVDIVGSCGSRGLMIILPETKKSEAVAAAERLRLAIAAAPMAVRLDRGNTCVTVSVGVAGYPEDSRTMEELLDSAEEALFEARTMGGDRVRQARKLQVVPHRS